MDKDLLEDCLAKGMSLPEIGRLVDKPPGTVGYWVAKHGLVANGREKFSPGKGKVITEAQLEPLVMEGLTIADIAERLGVRPNCVRYRIQKYGLPQPIEVRRTLRDHAVRTGDTDAMRVCIHHGMTQFLRDNRGTWRCRLCRQERVADRRRRVKRILVEEAGGACILCGYDRFAVQQWLHGGDRPSSRRSFEVRAALRELPRGGGGWLTDVGVSKLVLTGKNSPDWTRTNTNSLTVNHAAITSPGITETNSVSWPSLRHCRSRTSHPPRPSTASAALLAPPDAHGLAAIASAARR